MDKIIEAILKIMPFGRLFEWMGLSKELSAGLAVLVTAVLLYFITNWIKKLQAHLKNKKTATDLSPYFEYQKVKQARDLFIESKGQNNPPTHEEEMSDSKSFIVKKELIPWFIKDAFDEKKESNKYYLILADSGMGKTTLMINLYVRYHSKYGRKHNIRLIPFGDNRIVKHLEELAKKQDEAKNTILLLDAFDEYKGLLPPSEPDGLTDDERFRKKLDEIVELTRDFREVVITSRTQYFPGQEDKPYELKIPRFDDKGFHTLAKLYLSPFDEKEIQQYLNKKFGRLKFWNNNKKRIAKSIVEASPKLMVRPMLLAYIDYLVDSKRTFKTTYEIYDTLIEKWIEREADKRKHESTSREKFRNDLLQFSHKIALVIYRNHQQNNTLSIDKETARQLCQQENLDLQDYEITGQSLLTRDANHNWKFAHKSILEFFLAKKCIEDTSFARAFEFTGMDMVRTFYEEVGFEKIKPVFDVNKLLRIKGGKFIMGDEYRVKVSDFFLAKYPVTQSEYVKISKKQNPSHFKNNNRNPVENVSWVDAAEYCNLLNQQTGYNAVYDEAGNLLDSNGKTTTDITRVKGFRLPTEAEWEYAAGGGENNRTLFAGTNSENELPKFAWFDKNSAKKTHPVGELASNQLGLYDMSGNVWEWCTDGYDGDFFKNSTKNGVMENPVNCNKGSFRVHRGGGWFNDAGHCRVAFRNADAPGNRDYDLGFRVVFVP
ncbi:MAG: SUMF1/EgtB/PvdO family nonheme iron enzyme [Saprospiraceae bacterium]